MHRIHKEYIRENSKGNNINIKERTKATLPNNGIQPKEAQRQHTQLLTYIILCNSENHNTGESERENKKQKENKNNNY